MKKIAGEIGDCHENALAKSFEMSPHMTVAVSSTSIFSFVTNSVITPLVTKQNIEVERVTTKMLIAFSMYCSQIGQTSKIAHYLVTPS